MLPLAALSGLVDIASTRITGTRGSWGEQGSQMRRILGVMLVVLAMIGALLGANPAHAAASSQASPAPGSVDSYRSLTPVRLLDTRVGLGAAEGPVRAASTTVLQITGRGGVPSTGVAAVVVNVTVTGAQSTGWLTAWPGGVARPTASNLNFVAHQTVANQGIVKVGANGTVDLYSSAGTQLIADVSGYYLSGAGYAPLVPSRLVDTRTYPEHEHPVIGSTTVSVSGDGGVPSTGVAAVVLNVTAIPAAHGGFLTVYPSGVARPNTSTLNYAPHQITAGMTIAKIQANGSVEVYSSQSVDLLVDVVGWIPDASNYTPMTPVRATDTRHGIGAPAGRLVSGGTLSVAVEGAHEIPATGVNAVEVTITATDGTSPGFLTASSTGMSRPTTSTLNYVAGGTSANCATVKVGADGHIDISVSGPTYVIVDIVGYFTTPTTPVPGSGAWAQGAADAGNSGFNPGENQLTAASAPHLQTAWVTPVFNIEGAVIAGGAAYYVPMPTNTADHATLMVKNVVTGSTLWSLQLPLGTFGTGAVVGGQILLPFLYAPDGAGLLSVDLSTHRVMWRTVLANNGNYSGSVIAATGIAFFDDGTAFNAYRISDGHLLWSHVDTSTTAAAGYAAVGSTVYTLGGGNLIAYSATSGSRQWSAPAAASLTSGPIVADGHVYLSEGAEIQAYSADGCGRVTCGPAWDTVLPGNPSNVLIGAAGNGRVFAGWRDETGASNWPSYLRSLSATSGAATWTAKTRGSGLPPVRAGNLVWLQVDNNKIQAYDAATGAVVTTATIPYALGVPQPIAIADGSIVIGSDGYVVVLRAGTR